MSAHGQVNLLLRGQSNAQIFAGSGIYEVEHQLEAQLGVKVNILAEYGTDTSTIHAATAFLDWDTDGEQASLIRYLEAQPADVRDNPTITVWMHNEYEQKGSASEEQWLNEVRAMLPWCGMHWDRPPKPPPTCSFQCRTIMGKTGNGSRAWRS